MYWRAQWRRCDENERTNEATKKTQTRNEKPSQKRNKAKISKNEKKKKNLRRIRRNRDDWRLPVPIHYTICRRIHFSFALNFYATRPMLTVYLFISLTLLRSFDLVPRVCLCVCVSVARNLNENDSCASSASSASSPPFSHSLRLDHFFVCRQKPTKTE